MNRKYFIVLGENSSLAMKLNLAKQECTIGGPDRLESVMVDIVKTYFEPDQGQELKVQSYGTTRKVRVIFPCSYKTLLLAKTKMEAGMIQVIQTKKHGRLMR